MKAIVITQPGAPDVLQLQDVPDPVPAPGEILIETYATALNRADLLQRQGRYDPPPGTSPYPGLEVAGTVAALGEGVQEPAIGQRVMALLPGGGYAERVTIPASLAMPIPPHLSFGEAAAIPEAWLTAYSNMIEIAGLQPGERVLIHAGASGVGTAAIQLAKWRGATVFTTASSGKLAALEALGADYTIDYQSEEFDRYVLDITSNEGVNVIIDFIGATYWSANLRALARWGRIVFVGTMGGNKVELNLSVLMGKKLSVYGSTLRDRTVAQKAALVAAFSSAALPEFESGRLRPVLDPAAFTLEQVAEAHRYMEANRNVGKIVVNVRPG